MEHSRSQRQQFAAETYEQLVKLLRSTIEHKVPEARFENSDELVVRLGDSVLTVSKPVFHEEGVLLAPTYSEGPDVIASSSLTLYHPVFAEQKFGGTHSLWYGDVSEVGMYHWHELGFCDRALLDKEDSSQDRRRFAPFALSPDAAEAQYPFNSVLYRPKHLWPPTRLDSRRMLDFAARWQSLLVHDPEDMRRYYDELLGQSKGDGYRVLGGERGSRRLSP